MEKSTPIGLVAGFGLVFGAIFLGDGWQTFFDPKSLMIVVGGTLSGLLVSFTIDEVKQSLASMKALFGYQAPEYDELADSLLEYAKVARRDGPLALDAKLDEVDDDMLKMAIEMAVDGVAPSRAEAVLRTRMTEAASAPALLVKFLNKAGMYAPAFGMVGTLIGLIQMLQNLSDPTAIGPAMAVAMITTFYGALLANLVFLPMAAKAQSQIAMSAKGHEMIRIATLGILANEAPGAIGQQLRQFTGGEAEPAAAPTPLRKAA